MLRKLLGLGNSDDKESERVQTPAVEDPLTESHFKGSQIGEEGSVDGLHFTEYVEQIKQLKREKRHDEAIELFLKIVDATEAESKVNGWGVAPAYYEDLAIIYRREKRFADEVAILERYDAQHKSPGAKPKVLANRLVKARKLADEN